MNDPLEVFLAIVPTVFLSFITVNLYPVFVKNKGWQAMFLVDLTTCIIPLLLAETILADHLMLLNTALLLISVGIGIKNARGKVKTVKKDETVLRACITNLRSTTSILSIIAILAVDFTIFPSRFQKTANYGFSLMDVGVGTFLISNAMVAPETRGTTTPPKKTFVGVLVLIALGLQRYLLLIFFNYQVNVLEYGIHWNFFFTLAAAKAISAVILSTNDNNMWTCGAKGLTVLIVHQTALTCCLEPFVFSDAPREDFFSANREGIVSSMGYAGLYLLEVAMSFQDNKKSALKFLTNSLILAGITCTLHTFFDVSRCVANSTYCFWILLLSYILRTLYYTMGEFMRRNYGRGIVTQTTFVFEAINYNPLVFFMCANFMTGFVNLVVQTETFGPIGGLFLLVVYLCLNCLIVSVLFVRKIKLKC